MSSSSLPKTTNHSQRKQHPAQELWNKITWQKISESSSSSSSLKKKNDFDETTTKATRTTNETLTTTTTTTVVPITTTSDADDDGNHNGNVEYYFDGNDEYRLPPLWKTYDGIIVLQKDNAIPGGPTTTTTTTEATTTATVAMETMATTATATSSGAAEALWCNGIAVQRYYDSLQSECRLRVLPTLIIMAVLEESLHRLVTTTTTTAAAASTNATRTVETTTRGRSRRRTTTAAAAAAATTLEQQQQEEQLLSQPRYYTTTPNSYLVAPVVRTTTIHDENDNEDDNDEDDNESTRRISVIGTSTPTQLWSRIKIGCMLAYEYNRQIAQYDQQQQDREQMQQQQQDTTQQQQQLLLGVDDDIVDSVQPLQHHNHQRRSQRLATVAIQQPLLPPTKPHPLVKGGRIATWWLENEHGSTTSRPISNNNNNAVATTTTTTQQQEEGQEEMTMDDEDDEAKSSNNNNNGEEQSPPQDSTMQHEEDDDDEPSGVDDDDKDDDDDDDFEPESSSDDDDDDDQDDVRLDRDDIPSQHGGDDDDDDESVSYSTEEESEDDDDDDSDDDNVSSSMDNLIYRNPHFAPTRDALLEYLGGTGTGGGRGRPAKSAAPPAAVPALTLQHIQDVIVYLLKHQVPFEISSHLDTMVVKYTDAPSTQRTATLPSTSTISSPSSSLPPPPLAVVLECTTGESVEELEHLDAHDFQRCKFSWKRHVPSMSPGEQQEARRLLEEARQEEEQRALEEHHYAELAYKREKAWAWFRYKGITSGYTKWPQWTEAVSKWRQEEEERKQARRSAAAATATAASTNVPTATTEQVSSSAAAAAADVTSSGTTTANDASLARAMQEQEEPASAAATTSTTARRSTRTRAAADGGSTVFYGGQAGLSHKQLMDTIVRMTYQQPFQTMVALSSLVAEESNNPLHRIRVALGKLLWKLNQVTKVSVNSVWTDLPLWNLISKDSDRGLLQVPAQLKEDETVEEPSVENSGDTDAAAAADTLVETKSSLSSATKLMSTPTRENLKHLKVLEAYIRILHQTEMELRSLILRRLTSVPIGTVAIAADERAGSLEAVDAADFEGSHSSIDWSTSGHALLNQEIFRPSFLSSYESSDCMWYKVKDYVPSVPMPPPLHDDPESKSDGRASSRDIAIGKEPLAVERRMRFRAYPVTHDGKDLDEDAILVLTEAQVRAGIMAANLERKSEAPASSLTAEHPFAMSAGTNIILRAVDEPDLPCQVAGYDTMMTRENGSSNGEQVEHRILVLPKSLDESESKAVAFWAVASIDEGGALTCRPVQSPKTYKILLSDCDSSSSAFRECQEIVEFLYRQPHSQVFGEPVDPVALNIPTYFSVVKHPMDISTLSANLERGMYSNIPPGQNVGRSPVARMLNGPFKDDVLRIFDNAMLFNPPDDWIYHTAASTKRAVLKKIDQVSRDADDRFSGVSPRRMKKSIYVDEDSDVDMYEYESDRDDDDYSGRRTRKRKRVGGSKVDFSTYAMEAPISLQKTLSDTLGLRGPLSTLPIDSEAAGFSLSSEWNCRHQPASVPEEIEEDAEELQRKKDMEELLLLHREVEEIERAGLRRSTRTHPTETINGNESPVPVATVHAGFEYFLSEGVLPPTGDEETDAVLLKAVSNRAGVESQRETLHEVYYAKLYQQLSKFLHPVDNDFGSYVNSSFPPFLGRVIPSVGLENVEGVTWEIRSPYVLPAIRWVLRGLIESGHLVEVESGVILTNDIYYADDSQQPFDVLDLKEIQRRRRAIAASEEEESEEETEMSEYEKLRAERVARNAERLKALGLA